MIWKIIGILLLLLSIYIIYNLFKKRKKPKEIFIVYIDEKYLVWVDNDELLKQIKR